MTDRRSSRALGPEALLAHREWIERVAHALVLGDADGGLAPGTYTLSLDGGEPVVVSLGDGDHAQIEIKGGGPR